MKLWKVVMSMLFVALLLPGYTALAADIANPVQLTLDGKKLQPRVPARIVNNYTLVPVRVIAEQFGAQVDWDDNEKKVTVQSDKIHIQLFVNRKDAYINGVMTMFSVAPINENDTVLVPLRFVLERFDVQFKYDENTKTVHMTTTKPAPVENVGNGGNSDPNAPGSNNTCNPAVSNNSGTPNGTEASNAANGTASTVSGSCSNGQQSTVHVTGIEMAATGLIIRTDGKQLQPNVFSMDNPDRIVFDVTGATLDPTLAAALAQNGIGTLPSAHALVSQVRFSQYSENPATVRVTLDLKTKAFYYPIPNAPAGQFAAEISTSHVPSSKAVVVGGVKKYKIVLDAGHGGKDSGAVSIIERQEKEFNLTMVKKVGAILEKEKNLMVLYTRTDDTFVELDDRAKFANDQNAALFLSIHANQYLSTSRGVETYYWREDSIDLAEMIHEYVLNAGGLKDRGVRQNNFRVVVKTTMPAALLEVGYLSNKEEAALLFNEAYQNKVAAGIADAIKAYVGQN